MKRFIAILFAAVVAVSVGFAQNEQKNIAVATFSAVGNAVTQKEAESITVLYISKLVRTGKVSIYDRRSFDALIAEMKFQDGNWASKEKTVQLQTATGATVLGRGQIFKLGDLFYITATMIDANTAEIISSSQKSFKTINDVNNILGDMAKEISEKIVSPPVKLVGKKAAIATFEVVGDSLTKEDAEAITELYIGHISDRVSIFDRKNFDTILAEMKFQSGDWASKEKTVELGHATGANVVGRGEIFELGNTFYITESMIDTETAQILSSYEESFSSIDDLQKLLPSMAIEISRGLRTSEDKFSIGDIGPGGGIVFYINGNRAWECSENLGNATWESAKTMCRNYRGGGYSDWYLPTKDELNTIYQNIRKTGKISGNGWYWSSSPINDTYAWGQRFSDGYQGFNYKYDTNCVRAVRAFSN